MPAERNASVAITSRSTGAPLLAVGMLSMIVIKLANQLIIDGVRRGASDIHVEPNGAKRPLHELLIVDAPLREAIGRDKVQRGLTDLTQVLAVCFR